MPVVVLFHSMQYLGRVGTLLFWESNYGKQYATFDLKTINYSLLQNLARAYVG